MCVEFKTKMYDDSTKDEREEKVYCCNVLTLYFTWYIIFESKLYCAKYRYVLNLRETTKKLKQSGIANKLIVEIM